MDLADLREALGPGQPGYRARQLYEAIYRGQASGVAGVSTLPAALRQALAERHSMGLPEIARRYESADGTRRYLLRLADGRAVETVLMPEGRRDTICISSQVGCAVDCKFCMTALLGLERNLTAGEIVGQVLVDNHPMLNFVRHLGFTLRRLPDETDVMEARLELTPAPDAEAPPRQGQ